MIMIFMSANRIISQCKIKIIAKNTAYDCYIFCVAIYRSDRSHRHHCRSYKKELPRNAQTF